MAGIFVSYSRKNKDFCRRLTDELQKRNVDVWVDWEGIPPTVVWMKEVEKGIEEADAFLAIVSPDWLASSVCQDELSIAVKNGKRLIPVVPCDIAWSKVPAALGQLNFIFFTEEFDFNQQLDKLFTAWETDYDWLKAHRRLQVKALEWERGNQDSGFLLRGRDLDEAEQEISVNATKDPNPTDIQRAYVLRSRQEANKQRRIWTGILVALVVFMIGVIALLLQPTVADAIARAYVQDQTAMIGVPAGRIEFQFYSTVQPVDVPAFNIELHPVTRKLYEQCVGVDACTPPIRSETPGNSQTGQDTSNDPAVYLTIAQAATYCEWIGRQLPSAFQWERAAGYVSTSKPDPAGFSPSGLYEWTASYTRVNSQSIEGHWNGLLNDLNIDWLFLQEAILSTPTGDALPYTNFSGALGASQNVGFRCVEK